LLLFVPYTDQFFLARFGHLQNIKEFEGCTSSNIYQKYSKSFSDTSNQPQAAAKIDLRFQFIFDDIYNER
jgi:hypothetical protein